MTALTAIQSPLDVVEATGCLFASAHGVLARSTADLLHALEKLRG